MTPAAAPPGLDTPVRGPAQGRLQRALATTVVAIAVIGLLRLELGAGSEAGLVGAGAGIGALGGVGLGAVVVLLAGWWFVVSGTTTIDERGIVQSGLPEKRVSWDEIQYATHGRFALLPSVRRLRVKTTRGRRIVFAGATPALQAAFARIGAAYPPPL